LLAIIGVIILTNFDEKEIKLDNVSLKEIDEYSGIALMLEQSDGTYEKSENNDWPTKGYKLNQRLSGCVDESGNTIKKALTYEYGTLKVKTRVNASCYLYFDSRKAATEELINTAGSDLWDSTLEDDGYRYVGTNPDNYICFGTDSQSECLNDTDKYMYRIIGIFEDSEGNQHLKLIKKEALNTAYQWHSANTADTNWEDSDLYKGLNGSYFATNSEYSYMQDTNWTDKIENWTWTATNTLSYSNAGPDYYDGITIENVYLHEMNRNSKTNTIGEWSTISSKIGLMYVNDYYLSLGETILDYAGFKNKEVLKTGWMHLSNNDSAILSSTTVGPLSEYEWTMSRYDSYENVYFAWRVSTNGSVGALEVHTMFSARPVFYLESDVELKEGLGTSSEPYIINNDIAAEEIIGTAGSDLWESTLEEDGYRYVGTNPDNYVCFGYSDATKDCDFTNTTNTDLYAYRIIGIFEDEEGNQHLKLIKKEALNTGYMWYNDYDYENDTSWGNSDLYEGLNGDYFLDNTTYSYMQDSTWTDKIENWTWTATNTQTYYKYDTTSSSSVSNVGAHYYYSWPVGIYNSEHEIDTTTGCYQTSSGSAINCRTTATYTYPEAKIGLMYASDYAISLGETASIMTGSTNTNRTTLKTGWVHISNNDTGAPSSYEWTSSRDGYDGDCFAWRVDWDGSVGNPLVGDDLYSVRPVFYLTSDTQLSRGIGTSDNPYIVK